MEHERRDHLQTLERGLDVIAAFDSRGPLMTVGELATLTGLSKSIVRRILLTLERLGYARTTAGRFALTPKVLTLGYAYLSSVRLTGVARPIMESLTDRLGVSSSLASLDGTDIVYVDRVQRGRITSINLATGTRLPAHATSLGHVLLAYAASSEVDLVLSPPAGLASLTDYTLTDPKTLRQRLALIRQRGWDAVDQELEIGRRSAAAPVFDSERRVIAALGLSCGTLQTSMQVLTDEFVPPLLEAAETISGELGANVQQQAR